VTKNNIQCINNAPFKEDIGVGTYNCYLEISSATYGPGFIEKEGDAPKTALVWRGVGHGQKLNMEFIPCLRGYIDTNPCREDRLIKGMIDRDRLFDEDFTTLDEHTTWVITRDKASGVFSIDEEIRSDCEVQDEDLSDDHDLLNI